MRISFIIIDAANFSSGNCNIDEFLFSSIFDNNNQHLIANYTNNEDPSGLFSENPLNVYGLGLLKHY